MTTGSRSNHWTRALIAGQFLAVMWMGYSLIQSVVLRDTSPLDASMLWRIPTVGFVFGFLPGVLLVALSSIVRQRAQSTRVQWLLFWLTPLVGAVLGVLFALAAGQLHSIVEVAAVLGIFGGYAICHRKLRRRSEPPAFDLSPLTFAWLMSAVALSVSIQPVNAALSPDLYLGPTIISLASLTLSVLNDKLRVWWNRATESRWRKYVPAVVGLGSVGWLVLARLIEEWSAGIYLPLKTVAFMCGAISLWMLFDPWLADVARRRSRALAISSVLQLAGLAGLVWMLASPVGQRFGSSDPNTTIGLTASVLSQWSDADGDGFYATEAGGNDCDDSDPMRTPAAPVADRNCWSKPTPAQTPPRRFGPPRAEHAIIFVSDATRAELVNEPDQLARFPHLEKLADESAVFERAYSPGNATMMSLVPMLTGISPATLTQSSVAQDPESVYQLLPPRWLFQTDRRRFCTAFIVQSHPYAKWLTTYYPKPQSLDVASYEFELDETGHSAPLALENVREALDRCAGRRLLMVVYVDDPHIEQPAMHYTCADGSPGGKECYLEEVDVVDESLGEILALLDERGILDRAVTLFTADHGEAFGEHTYISHATSVYDIQTHVPLLVRLPQKEHSRIAPPVSLMSLKATVAEATGAPIPRPMPYPSLLGLIDDPETAYPVTIAENWLGRMRPAWRSPTSAMIDGDFKIIYDWRTTSTQLFNIAEDPAELTDLSDEQPAKVREMMQKFRQQESRLLAVDAD